MKSVYARISEVKSIGATLPYLKGCYFYCKGTNKRMRDLARWPMENGSVIRILDDCASYVIIADEVGAAYIGTAFPSECTQ